jgi:hypothetical protein
VRVGEGRFTAEQAEEFRAEGRRVVELVERGLNWWDDAWAEWRPDPGWDGDT